MIALETIKKPNVPEKAQVAISKAIALDSYLGAFRPILEAR